MPQRKTEFWPTDYVINRWAVNTAVDVAEPPGKAVLIAEPNMARGAVIRLMEIIAWSEWGSRPDLEQNLMGSLSFAFVDGHAARLNIAEGDNPHLADYPELFMTSPGTTYTNYLWLVEDQSVPVGE